MTTKKSVEFCILNIAANPHPEGIYPSLLEKTANVHVNYRGNDFATISKPTLREEGFYQGRIVCWTDIDTSEPAINKIDLSEIPLEDLDIRIPSYVGLNGRVFSYTLREKDHKIFVETKNDLNKRLSATMVGKIFTHLMSGGVLGVGAPIVEITVVPDEDTLKRILSIPNISRLKIHMVRPNQDDINDEVEKVLKELEQQNATAQDIVLTARPGGDGLQPSKRAIAQAMAAELNGYVEASGKEDDGQPIRLSTKEHPKILKTDLDESSSIWGAALALAKRTIVRQRNAENL
ncbi:MULTISPECIES: DUF4747 family protein [unclassified Brucella]|uniref:DUF4747 family protein n=1 Tax=unclassified Brucella TaxID=2632610 RepID=UPI0012AE1096|nr:MULTISPECIES: DUF4747 family protein [unclassified Brucella]MRN44931.1 DUF4747 family protein [Brucella sp. 09RB8913]MRN58738.1 DUF4747 family protein [Brucella sp. 09RB8918]